MIRLISRSAICWTTLPLALIRQPPSPIGTAISILSLSVAEPANPFHPPGAVLEVACRLCACTLPVCCPCRLPASWDQGPSELRATYSHPPIATLFQPQPALRNRLDSFILSDSLPQTVAIFPPSSRLALPSFDTTAPSATMNMTDEELDRDWKPNGRRPQSWVPLNLELSRIDDSDDTIADPAPLQQHDCPVLLGRADGHLSHREQRGRPGRADRQAVSRRHPLAQLLSTSPGAAREPLPLTRALPRPSKQQINTQTTELEALEARIREMEQRLTGGNGAKATSSPRTSRPPVANAFDNPDGPPPVPEKDQQRSAGRDQQSQKYGGSRPGTARASQQAVPGALPPTPVGSEGESEPHECPRSAPRPPRARLSASIASSGKFSSASSSTTLTRVRESPGDDSGSVQSMSMSGSVTSADYVVVPRPDGDGDKDI